MTSARLLAAGALALSLAACDSAPVGNPGGVAVSWLQAKASYDGAAEWDLEAPSFRAGQTRKEAAEERKAEQSTECPEPGAPGCLFPEGVEFRAGTDLPEGDCRRVLVRARLPDGTTSEEAVVVIGLEDDWRVIDWRAQVPEDPVPDSVALECGLSR